MYLRSAHIRHYKSLDNALVEFSSPITVLVGPNAVGKSNVVDCLRFVRDAVATDLEHAVSTRGGIARVRQYSKTKPYKVSVKLEFVQDFPGGADRAASYEFAIESLTASNYIVDVEKSTFFAVSASGESPIKRTFARDRSGKVKPDDAPTPYRVAQDQLALGQLRGLVRPPAWPLERFVREWRYAEIYPRA